MLPVGAMNGSTQQPRLEVICGPMFSGKTHELIRRLSAAMDSGLRVIAAKPRIELNPHELVSLTGARWPSRPIGISTDLVSLAAEVDVLGLDEAQLMDSDLVNVVDHLRRQVRLVVTGLDLDFRGEPFGAMPHLIERADEVTRLTASCEICHNPATLTQRVTHGEVAQREDPTIRVGGRELYEPRCERCFVTPR